LSDSAILETLNVAGYSGIYFAGFDTGTQDNLACCLVDVEGNYVGSKLWKMDQKAPLVSRLVKLSFGLYNYLCNYNFMIMAAGIEEPWVGMNKQTALKLAKVWGIVFDQCNMQTITAIGIQPSEAKKALTGNGRAKKPEVKRIAGLLAEREFESQDEADAFAVALATRAKVIEMAMEDCSGD
jgi:Holliday junction resolvasome RuvABC endonuclease subunit